METLSELNDKREELQARLKNLEEQKTSLEKEISFLIEQIPVLDMARYASLLESHTRALRGVRDMLQRVAEQEGKNGDRSAVVLPTN